MKKITFLRNLIVLVALLIGSGSAMGQPWVYSFGTGTGSFTSSTASTTFLPAPPSGTARVRVGTNPGSIVMANPGLTDLGSGTELQITSNTGSASTTKFSVYDYTAGKEGYVKFKIAFSGGTNGVYKFTLGDGATFSDNNAIANTQIFAGIEWTLGASNAISYKVLNNNTWGTTNISDPTSLFVQSSSTIYEIEVYINNTTAAINYDRSGTTYALSNSTWDLWVNGVCVGDGLAKGGLSANVNIDSYSFNHQNSVTAPGTIYIDDIEYSNSLPAPSIIAVATPTFSPVSGTYYSDQNVTISTETAGATIRYTTNGNDPDETSTIFSAPIAVSATTTIKAKAFKTDMDPSDVASATYTIVKTPTITVTEPTVPAMSIAVGGPDTETITVNASNLTGNITLAVTGDDADLFTLSTYTLVHSSGSVSNQSVTITYTPDAPATLHTAILTLSSPGAAIVEKELSGSATLAKPTATDATGINPSGFTANWDAVLGATSYELDVYKKQGSVATGLFISEYIEGSSNNKAIEIFNGTGSSVDLTGYNLKVYANGSVTPGSAINLSGTLANQSVYVVANSSANATILAKANITSGSLTHNGNDAVGLFNGTTLLDVVGPIGDASNWGLDMTLIRKSSVTSPVTTYDVNEWNQESNDYVLNLGSHSTITITPVSGSPFTVTGETSKAITGLTASTQYFYTVKAINGSFESLVSEEETVTTSFGTSTDNPSSLTNIYAHNAKIHFAATAGEKVEVYNAVGQKIISTLATDGQNELSVNAKGVMIVKIGSRLAKVIL